MTPEGKFAHWLEFAQYDMNTAGAMSVNIKLFDIVSMIIPMQVEGTK
jgi:hypothetical protein